jgi:phage host-nuclease inhibitor protein Gam
MGRKPEGQAEKMFKRFGKNVDTFIAELNDAKGNTSEEFQSRLEELKRSKDSLGEKFKDFREENKDKWDEVQSELERAGQEFKKAVNNLFANRNSN